MEEMHEGDKARLRLFVDGLHAIGLALTSADDGWYMTTADGKIKIALIAYDPNKPFKERFEIKAVYH